MTESVQQQVKVIVEFLSDSFPADKLLPADAIFVFGHIVPEIAEHAGALYKASKAPKIIVTGKGRDRIPGGFDSEAEYYRDILVSRMDIPENDLVIEKGSTNTLENVVFGIKQSREVGLDPKSLILCAMPPLLRRSSATFQKQFPAIKTRGSGFSMPVSWFKDMNKVQRLIEEFPRLVEYAQKGDIAEVRIPDEVIVAEKEIRQALAAK